jgi:hypothetical protein
VTNSTPNIHLVVAKFRENINWVFGTGLPFTIYNKDPDCKEEQFITLLNIGREAHTYLHYVVTNYNCLPDYVFFSEGNCLSNRFLGEKESLENLYNEIKNYKGFPRVKPMGVKVTETLEELPSAYKVNNNVINVYKKLFNIEKTKFIFYIGGQLIVPRSRIKFHSHNFYKHLYENISDIRSNGYCAWTLERLWPYIYDGKTKSYLDDNT